MGVLHEQDIPTIFQGVSRQPHSVRFPGQVQDAENVIFSVETGGFSKRPGTNTVERVSAPGGKEWRLHLISRDVDEKYGLVLADDGELVIVDLINGGTESVTIDHAGDADFFNKAPDRFSFLSVLDYTFVVDKDRTVALKPAPATSGYTYAALQLELGGISDSYEITINYGSGQSFSATHLASDGQPTNDIITQLADELRTNKPSSDWEIDNVGSFLFIRNTANNASWSIDTIDPHGGDAFKVTKDQVSDQNDLVSRARHDHIVEVKSTSDTEGFFLKFAADDTSRGYGRGVWQETVPPGTQVDFDEVTMPRALVRRADGFHLERLDWETKRAGGDTLVPPPDFVGKTIEDVVFHRNRLGFLSGETAYLSAAGDYFRFWPDSATDVLDTDPFGLTNTSDSVSKFYWAVPFRKSMFVMADEAQFEISGQTLTPTQGRIDLATQYLASVAAKPQAIGDELYFPAEDDAVTRLMLYVYSDKTVSETASDVSKHVIGFIPADVVGLSVNRLANEVFLLSDQDRSKLYVHRFYYQGEERVQSAWTRFAFPDAKIHSIGSIGSSFYLLAERDGHLMLELLETTQTPPETLKSYEWDPRMDCTEELTGVYDAGTDTTSWTLKGSASDSFKAVTSYDFPDEQQMLSISLTANGSTVTADGDWSAGRVLIGDPYPSHVELSKQFLREGDGRSVVNGRLQLRHMTLRYSNSGYFEVEVIPAGRPTKRWIYNGRTLGSAKNQVQQYALQSGRFRFGVGSEGETCTIKIKSDTVLPMTITSAAWVGFFNEITRQDRR